LFRSRDAGIASSTTNARVVPAGPCETNNNDPLQSSTREIGQQPCSSRAGQQPNRRARVSSRHSRHAAAESKTAPNHTRLAVIVVRVADSLPKAMMKVAKYNRSGIIHSNGNGAGSVEIGTVTSARTATQAPTGSRLGPTRCRHCQRHRQSTGPRRVDGSSTSHICSVGLVVASAKKASPTMTVRISNAHAAGAPSLGRHHPLGIPNGTTASGNRITADCKIRCRCTASR
jgi:hypothetical protein